MALTFEMHTCFPTVDLPRSAKSVSEEKQMIYQKSIYSLKVVEKSFRNCHYSFWNFQLDMSLLPLSCPKTASGSRFRSRAFRVKDFSQLQHDQCTMFPAIASGDSLFIRMASGSIDKGSTPGGPSLATDSKPTPHIIAYSINISVSKICML